MIDISGPLKVSLDTLGDFFRLALIQKIKDTGHSLTGSLEKSIKVEVKVKGGTYTVEVSAADYIIPLDRGVSRDKIPYNRGSGAGSSKYIDALVYYAEQRGMRPEPGQTFLNIAFAIATSQKQAGLPTVASRKYSKTGRRTGFIREVIDETKKPLKAKAEELIAGVANDLIPKMFMELIGSSKFIFIQL